MKVLTQILAVLAISISLITVGLAKNTHPNDSSKNENKKSKEFSLKDRNQNAGETQNREENRVIHGPMFVDTNADGFNDNAPDHDKDGIPNGQDSDYAGSGKGKGQQNFIDKDGNGITDNVALGTGNGFRAGKKNKKGYGPKDGTGNKGIQPQEGLGLGPGAKTGNCDGRGPKRKNMRGSQGR